MVQILRLVLRLAEFIPTKEGLAQDLGESKVARYKLSFSLCVSILVMASGVLRSPKRRKEVKSVGICTGVKTLFLTPAQ